MTYNVLDLRVKTQQQQNKKSKHNNPCESKESGPQAPQSDALPYRPPERTGVHVD